MKPKPSWIGANSAVMMMRSEKPLLPSGSLVLRTPTALRWMMPLELQLERAGVFAAAGIEEQEAATGKAAAIDRQADAVRRLEADIELQRPEIAAVVGEGETKRHADAVDRCGKRAELAAQCGRDLNRNGRRLRTRRGDRPSPASQGRSSHGPGSRSRAPSCP